MQKNIYATVACNLDYDLLSASLPLFKSERVEAIEWSFDTLYNQRNIPDWFLELLHTYSKANKLIGHGIYFSLFSGKWTIDQENWLKLLAQKCKHFNFDHITEHFGFMTGSDFHKGAPIGVPFTKKTLTIGRDRLRRIYEVCNCPVGIENLAFAYSMDEVKIHGEFLEELVSPLNGFIILDLHNLYCQIHNFNVDFDQLIQLYPLDKVREIHISGGSWESSPFSNQKIRRDTHDDSVPTIVFEMLEKTISICKNLKYVVLEQLGTALTSKNQKSQFQNDFLKLAEIVEKNSNISKEPINNFLPPEVLAQLGKVITCDRLAKQQSELSDILENAVDYEEVKEKLILSSLANSSWEIQKWKPEMVETARQIANKWKNGF